MNRNFIVHQVKPNSPAEKAGIVPGHRLLRINGSRLYDILDYKYLAAGAEVEVSIEKQDGTDIDLFLQKQYDEELGLDFANPTIGPMRRCQNNCIFCFIDQQPVGLRNSLYDKDDDYRMSFLFGNFITLTNTGKLDLKRIAKRHISPLYISIHATDPAVRKKMMRNPSAGNVLEQMNILARAGIKMHGQVVLCPGINDGPILEKTLDDLARLYPALETVAIVPVGLSRHRDRLFSLNRVTPDKSKSILKTVNSRQEQMINKYNNPFVYLADEFYLLANEPFPEHEHYGAYHQLENGVGLSRLFLNELESLKINFPPSLPSSRSISLVTGRSAEPLLKQLVCELEKIKNLQVQLQVVESVFWGEEVTVAGLLTGNDILHALKGKNLGDIVFVPAEMLKEKTGLFLDDYTVSDVTTFLERPVIPVGNIQELVTALTNNTPDTSDERTVPICHHR